MHGQARDFTLFVKAALPAFFTGRRVLDVGSGDINGNNRFLFDSCEYHGNDVIPAKSVTIVARTKDLPFSDCTFDTIISTECFEHDPEYAASFAKIYGMLKPGGLFCFTCASTGRAEHGTRRTSPCDSYGTVGNIDDVADYYRNLTELDLNEALELHRLFFPWDTYYNSETKDLYFLGIKVGSTAPERLVEYMGSMVTRTSAIVPNTRDLKGPHSRAHRRFRFVNVVIFHEGVPHEREMKAHLQRLSPPSVRQIFVTMREGPDSYDKHSGVLYVSGSESHTPLDVQSHIPGILHKSIVAMRHCLDTLEFDFLVRSNISTVIDFGRLPVDELPRGVAYGSTCVWYRGEPRAFASGTNIILSRAATELLVSAELDMTTIDDVAIGAFFARAGVTPTQLSSAMVWDTDDERGVVFRNRDFSDETRATDVRRIGQIVDRLLKRDGGRATKVGRYSYGMPEIRFPTDYSTLTIGSFCSIASHVAVYLGGEHRTDYVTTYPFGYIHEDTFPLEQPKGKTGTRGDVVIGNDVWIGGQVTIMSGVTIGDGAVIANNSHVVKDVAPYALVGGNPARLIRYRFTAEQIERLLEIKWWSWTDEKIGRFAGALRHSDIDGFIASQSNDFEPSKTTPALGFVILRHVISELTARYWVLCYESIRRVYPDEPILIIDDNSDPAYIRAHATTNATVVQSEYPQRGDLLPYLYYLTHKISDRVVIINDSAFITRKVPFCEERPYQHLWDFEHDWDQEQDEASMVGALDTDGSLRALHAEKARWKGCFGSMTAITHAYLREVDARFGIAKLTGLVTNRFHRMSFERVLACLLRSMCDCTPPSVYGDIHEYCPWGIPFDEGILRYAHLPVIRVWTGR